nr:PREDICTED: uncharacterized protein LOC105663026 [Megachile rotundata]
MEKERRTRQLRGRHSSGTKIGCILATLDLDGSSASIASVHETPSALPGNLVHGSIDQIHIVEPEETQTNGLVHGLRVCVVQTALGRGENTQPRLAMKPIARYTRADTCMDASTVADIARPQHPQVYDRVIPYRTDANSTDS